MTASVFRRVAVPEASLTCATAADADRGCRWIRVAGCDLGKATAKFVVGTVAADGAFAVEARDEAVHEGRPLEAFCRWYEQREIARCAALGATGLHAVELAAPAFSGLPADACLTTALPIPFGRHAPLNLVSFGARGYRVLSRSVEGRVRVLENEKCSSGTGETMVKIAHRFGLTIAQADRLARRATDVVPITARCSVFAKSEMTHFGNQGKPTDALFRGYFRSVAQYAAALLGRIRVEGPVYAIGGGARIRSVVEALSECLGQEVRQPEHPLHLEAIGAAVLAGEQALGERPAALPEDPAAILRPRRNRFAVLEPARRWSHRVTRLHSPSPASGADKRPTVLGLDLGSTGAKAVLTEIETGEIVRSVYDRTRGNPVAAARRLIEMLLTPTCPDVRAIGLTGSGREAAATVVRAAWPEAEDRIIVENEIVAHATAAIRCDPRNGRSLSVVEIGGQDAKFIQIRDGCIVESDLNKACSAGTGSFLEEQAAFYGMSDIGEFTRLAAGATRPPDLGHMCTVFVAEAAAEASNEGFDIADIFAAFQYSVIHNYINRVMGQRTFGERIFLQGKPATAVSLAWTLAAVTGRDVVVPPDPGAMGAWGIGLCALQACDGGRLLTNPALDLDVLLAAKIISAKEFQCADKRCATLCIIQRTRVEVGGQKRMVFSGGACPKYEISNATRPKLPKGAPHAFAEREALLAPYLQPVAADRVVGIPNASACHGYLPWLVTFVRELGLGVQCLCSDRDWLRRGEERCFCYDACTPVKLMHGLPGTEVDAILFPKFFTYADPDGSSGRTCPMEQALPEMMREAFAAGDRRVAVVHPKLSLERGLAHHSLPRVLRQAAVQLGAKPSKVAAALREAAEAQQTYWQQLAAIGARSLGYARNREIAAIVVCGPLHVIHERVVNAGIPRLLREQGVLALPMDCYPIPPHVPRMPRIVWSESNRALRTAVAARQRGDVYPLLLTSFGCGPGSFLEQLFCQLMEGYPHTVVESDGHGGTAGYTTRVQAFLHTVRNHDRRSSPPPAARFEALARVSDRPLAAEKDSQLVVFALGDRISSHIATAYRSAGFDAVPSGPIDAPALAAGRRDCSGKECLPYQVLWSSFKKHLGGNGSSKPKTLVQVPGEGMCRNCLFSLKDELSLQRLGLSERVGLRHFGPEIAVGWSFAMKVWTGIVVWDILFQLAAYCRPLARAAGEVERLYETFNDELEALLQRPAGAGLSGILASLQAGRRLDVLVDRAAAAFAALADRAVPRRTYRRVLLSGNIYVRLDEFASDQLIRRLNDRDLQVIVEPASLLTEYMAEERLSELMGLPKDWKDNLVLKRLMAACRRRLYTRVRARHPWLPATDLKAILAASRAVLDRYPLGEAPVTIGSVLHQWRGRTCDGVVVISPWGCGPALVSESLLRHREEIPALFVYVDGSPLDERRLDAFAFQLQRTPPRTADGIRAIAKELDFPQPLPQPFAD
jgi:activator of 2-hydroxyglutaryl-CoA dehydratase/predicted nucleotide-binding protein (sugar kinase/HSP70/actin superfamily)